MPTPKRSHSLPTPEQAHFLELTSQKQCQLLAKSTSSTVFLPRPQTPSGAPFFHGGSPSKERRCIFTGTPRKEADIAAAVLTMVVSASTVIARAFSRSVASATSSEPEKPTHIEETGCPEQVGWLNGRLNGCAQTQRMYTNPTERSRRFWTSGSWSGNELEPQGFFEVPLDSSCFILEIPLWLQKGTPGGLGAACFIKTNKATPTKKRKHK